MIELIPVVMVVGCCYHFIDLVRNQFMGVGSLLHILHALRESCFVFFYMYYMCSACFVCVCVCVFLLPLK
jgi:hypothetical protein